MDHRHRGRSAVALRAAPHSLLILRFSALGDVVLTTPVIDTIAQAWPDTRIVFATKEAFAGLLRADPRIAAVEGLTPGESVAHFRRRLLAHRPDAVLDLHGKLRSRILCASLVGVPAARWHKRRLGDAIAVRMRWRTYRAGMHIAERYRQAAERLAQGRLPAGRMGLFVGERSADEARVLLDERGRRVAVPLVGMAPGAVWWTKRWPEDRFAALAQALVARGAQVVLLGGSDESALAERIARVAAERDPGAVINLVGHTPLSLLSALVASCDAFVANDSGPMHVARALGVPTLALFGSTDPEQFDFAGHALMYASEPCAPCSLYGLSSCPEKHFRCMTRLSVDDALTHLDRLLAGGRVHAVVG